MLPSPWLILLAGWALKNLSSGGFSVPTQDSPEEKDPSNLPHSGLSNTPKTVPAVGGGRGSPSTTPASSVGEVGGFQLYGRESF